MIDLELERVRGILRSAGDAGVCALEWDALGIAYADDALDELAAEGLDIYAVPCNRDGYHADEIVEPHVRYVWHWCATPRMQRLLPVIGR